MTKLHEQSCRACSGDAEALKGAELAERLKEVPEWTLREENEVPRLTRTFKFEDFRQALDFTIKVGEMAEEEDHHPAILTEWGKVNVTWWTHKIDGLHQNDFIAASKTDRLFDS